MLSYRKTYARPRASHVRTGSVRLHFFFGCGQTLQIGGRSQTDGLFQHRRVETAGGKLCALSSKGRQSAVECNIQNRTYEKDGEKRYITEIVADRVEFLGRPAQSNGGSGYDEFGRKEAIEDLPSVEDDTELPF